MRALKSLLGLALLPLCYALGRTLADLLLQLRPGSLHAVPATTWGLAGGFLFWLGFWALMPRPIRTYVLGHELTHALWGLLWGARVSRLRISPQGGSVQVSKTNFLITLAPYFFPFYTFLVLLAYAGTALFVDPHHYKPFWAALIGLTWGFHLTFTLTALTQDQTDIHQTGPLFSYAIILLFNVAGLCLAVVAIAPPTLDDLDGLIRQHLLATWQWIVPAGRQ